MKNSDENDPLKENERNEKQPEKEQKEPLKEENKTKEDQPKVDNSAPDPVPQEKGTESPDEEALVKSNNPDSPPIPDRSPELLIDDDEEQQKNATYDDVVDSEDHDDHGIGEEIAAIQKEQELRKSPGSPEKKAPSTNEEETAEDAGPGAEDAGTEAQEAGPVAEDAGTEAQEAGPDSEDAGTEAEVAGPVAEDAGTEAQEAGPDSEDVGTEAEVAGPVAEDTGTELEDAGTEIEDADTDANDTGPDAEDTSTELEDAGTDSEDADTDSEDAGQDAEIADPGAKQKPVKEKIEEQRVNFSLLSKEDLVKLMKEKLDHPGKSNMRRDVEEIKQAFYEKINATVEEKRKHFLEEGGDLEDFKPAADPLEGEMKDLLKKYRGLKAEYTRQLEKTKQENYRRKQEILEELRLLMEGQEGFEVTFRKFKDLQKKWFSSGIVPQQNLKDLWDSYNYFVDKFNDYVRINRELRSLDLKKNLELKIQLCQRTEELDKEPNIVQAFKSLQKFHTRWREIGPVPRENRDEIWERFKQATSVINKKHQDYHSRLKESLYENLERKTNLCEQVEAIASAVYETHGAWVEKTNVVLEIQKQWKTIGYAPKKDNNLIYARFRKACDTFFGNKAQFYASAFEEQKDNLKLKQEITEKAEALKESQDWKETTTELIHLQKQWKAIGPVPRRESDKLWRRFRAACDFFFNSKSKYFENIDSTFEDNLKEKEGLIVEMEAFELLDTRKKNLEALDEFQARFNAIGYVPSVKKDWIKDQFRQAQDRLLERIGLDESARSIYKFRHRVLGMKNAPRSEMKLNFERDKLVNKLQQLKSDIGVWENNIGFFKQSDSSEETIQGFHEQIEAAHERIRVLEEKIRILDDMENAN